MSIHEMTVAVVLAAMVVSALAGLLSLFMSKTRSAAFGVSMALFALFGGAFVFLH